MKMLAKLGIVVCLAAVAGYAETWNGKLIDATCYEKYSTAATAGQKPPSLDKIDKDCAPTASTTVFALHASGKVYKLDAAGNSQVQADVRGGVIKADKDGDTHITITGTLQGDSVKVDSVKGK